MATPAAQLAVLVTANTAQANAALAKTQAQLGATAATGTKTSALLKKSMLGVGVAVAAAGAGAFKLGKEFDDAYDKIRVGTGKTGKALKGLEEDFKNVVSDVPADFDDAATAVADLNTRLGVTGKPLRSLAKQFTELGRITETDVGGNIKTVTRAFGDWEVKTADQSAQLDKFFRASQASGASVAELADNVVKFGAPLRQVGFTLDEATAMFASFEKAGVNTQTMMPGLRMALKSFLLEDIDPRKGLLKTFRDIEDGTMKTSDALAIFGQRAGADMVEAIQQGRFELDDFTKAIATGDDSIRKAGRNTMDFNEQWQLFKNKIMVGLEPAATAVFNAIGNGMEWIARINFGKATQSLRNFFRTNKDGQALAKSVANLGEAFKFVFGKLITPIIKRAFEGVKDVFKGFIQVLRGFVRVITGILTLDFKQAWLGAQDIVKGSLRNMLGLLKTFTSPFRGTVDAVADILPKQFKDAAKAVGRVFSKMLKGIGGAVGAIGRVMATAARMIKNVVDFIVKAVNKAVGAMGDLKDKVPSLSLDLPSLPSIPTPKLPFQKGGGVPGIGTGDKVPAMLEPGEVVINREAVKKLGGPQKVNVLNQAIPRFAKGGIAGTYKSQSDVLGAKPGFIPFMNYLNNLFGPINVISGYRPGDPRNHGQGNAVDIAAPGIAGATSHATLNATGEPARRMDALNAHMERYMPLSALSGDFLWRTWTGGNHFNHIHRGITSGEQESIPAMMDFLSGLPKGGAGFSQLGKIKIKGTKGPLRDILQGASNRIRKAGNTFLTKQAGTAGFGQGKWSGAAHGAFNKGQLVELWEAVNGGFGDSNLMAAIAMAESTGNPRAVSYADARGLWQIHWPAHASWASGIGDPFDPEANAKMAARILRDQGLGAWDVYTGAGGGGRSYQNFLRKGGIAGFQGGGGFGLQKAIKKFGSRKKKKRIKARKGMLKKIRGMGLGSGTMDRLAAFSDDAEKHSEFAALASSLTQDVPPEVEEAFLQATQGMPEGKQLEQWREIVGKNEGRYRDLTESDWLHRELASLFALRTELVNAKVEIDRAEEQAKKVLGKAEDEFRKLRRKIKRDKDAQNKLQNQIGRLRDRQKKAKGKSAKKAIGKQIQSKRAEIEKHGNRLRRNQPRFAMLKETLIPALKERIGGIGETKASIIGSGGSFPDGREFGGLRDIQGRAMATDPGKAYASTDYNQILSAGFGGRLFDTALQLRSIAADAKRITVPGAGGGAGGGAGATDSELADLLRQQLLETQARERLLEKQMPVFAGYFARGGMLGAGQWGIAGEAGPEMVTGPAQITPAGEPNIEVNVYNDPTSLEQRIEVLVDGKLRKKARSSGSGPAVGMRAKYR